MPQGLLGPAESQAALEMKQEYHRAGKKTHSHHPHPQPHAATEFPPAGSFTSLSAASEGVKTDNLSIAGLKASWAPS